MLAQPSSPNAGSLRASCPSWPSTWRSASRSLDSVKLRVGALPQYPSNALNYNLTWSTDGVINEYCEPCEAIVNGVRREVPPLEEREEFSLDGVTYEAFNTSGGSGPFATPSKGRSALSITAQSAIPAMRRSCARSSTICACAIAGMY